ncbi:MAG: ribosome maturation factor RimM [Gammaproteobacteria bacterium]|nr:ribosome maturation factor RimM [Gammaproteobacteria bacterium]
MGTEVSSVDDKDPDWIILGRIAGLFGVKGWVKVYSHTSPRANILEYKTWHLLRSGVWEKHKVKTGKVHGKGIIVKLAGCNDRDQAASLMGVDIAIRRNQLPAVADNEYYWSDLEGLAVITSNGESLGKVDHLFETGANDVIVVEGKRRRLIPFIEQVIVSVDLEQSVITVDWDPEF